MSTLTFDELIALNQEIAALARAGVPLERGMNDLGRDLPGRLGRVMQEIGRRSENGENLEDILADGDTGFPRVYRAIVQAGVRSGDLPAALESVAGAVRRMAELRRMTGAAMLYPLILVGLGYVILYLAFVVWMPLLAEVYLTENFAGAPIYRAFTALGENPWWRVPWLPILVLIGLTAAWVRSGRTKTQAPALRPWKSPRRILGMPLPTIGQVLSLGRASVFAELAALLIERETPLHVAIVLAADASGDRRFVAASRELAQRIEQGAVSETRAGKTGFPPLLGWLLAAGGRQPRLAESLRQASDSYQRQAQRMADTLAVYLPIVLTATIGGSAALLVALMVLAPWYIPLHQFGS